MKELIVERNLIHASSVGRRLLKQDICGCMKEFIVERNLIHASIVGSHFLKLEIWGLVKELTVERNLIHASSVGSLLVHARTHSDRIFINGFKRYEKLFVRADDFRVHEKPHNGEKPYACKQCRRKFK